MGEKWKQWQIYFLGLQNPVDSDRSHEIKRHLLHVRKAKTNLLSHLAKSHVCLFAILWTIALQAPLPMGFSSQEYWHGLPCSSPGYLSNPGIKPTSLMSPALVGGSFTTSATWKPHDKPRQCIKKQRHYLADKVLSSQSYGFSSSDV